MNSNRKKAVAGACASVALIGVVLAAGPAIVQAMGSAPYNPGNDTAVIGEYTAYDPSAQSDAASGAAIEGSDEEKLQQERIAGGAVGAVTSKNIEPLSGIVDAPYASYVPSYGIEMQAPALDLSNPDTLADIISAMPKSHQDANLSPNECTDCHAQA